MDQTKAPPESEGTAARRGETFTLLCVLYMAACTMGNLYAPQPLLNAVSQEFGTGQADTALVVSISMLALAVAPILYGPVISRLSTQRILVGACLLFALYGIGVQLTTSFSALLVLRGLEGLLFPAVFTAIMTYISNHYHGRDLQRIMAAYVGCTGTGGFLGRMLAGGFSSLFGWRTALLLLALMSLPALWGLARLPAEHKDAGRWHHYSEYLAGLKEPGVAALILVDMLLFFVFSGINNFLPFRMADLGLGNSEFLISLMYTGFLLGVVISFNAKALAKLCGNSVRLIAFGLLPYFPMLLMMTMQDGIMLFIAMSTICVSHFAAYSNLPGLINRLTSQDHAMINSLFLTCHYASGMLGAWLPGYAYKAWGWNASLLMYAILVVLALGAVWRLRNMPSIRT